MTTRRRGGVVPPSTTVVIKQFLISAVNDLCKQHGNNSRIMSYILQYIPFLCKICTDTKTMKDAFYICACSHTYCSDCIVRYIDSNLQNNIVNIRCPSTGCTGLLEADSCRRILPAKIFDRWGIASCEAAFDVSLKVYCPFPDCSDLMVKDRKEEVIGRSRCGNCKRMFCAECKVAWHEGMNCREFEKLNSDENDGLTSLAKDKKWRRCPNCRIYVARSTGCDHMTCRCHCKFCYKCGDIFKSNFKCSCFKPKPVSFSIPARRFLLPEWLTSERLVTRNMVYAAPLVFTSLTLYLFYFKNIS